MRRVRVYIDGRVQGVFFRWHIKSEAQRLGVKGWVRNLLDGRVECVFEGRKEDIDELLEFCRKGPPGAIVKKVDIIEEDYSNEFSDFQIRY